MSPRLRALLDAPQQLPARPVRKGRGKAPARVADRQRAGREGAAWAPKLVFGKGAKVRRAAQNSRDGS